MQHETHKEEKHEEKTEHGTPKAAVNSLAMVGFLTLLLFGILLAIYAVRYIPAAVSRLTQKHATTTPSLTVVSGGIGSTTIPFAQEDIVATTTTIGPVHLPPTTNTNAPKSTTKSSTSAAPRYYGLPDLSVNIVSAGYLANGTNESFTPSQFVPAGARAAVQFTVANTGTNPTGPWSFIVQLPTANGYVFTSPVEQNLNPGDHILFTLGFDQANPMPGPQTVTVIADPNNQVTESNETNNSQSASFQIGY